MFATSLPPLTLLLLLFATFCTLGLAFAEDDDDDGPACVICPPPPRRGGGGGGRWPGPGDDDDDGESLNVDQLAEMEAQMLQSIAESVPAEAKQAIARRDVLWFGLGAVNFELMPSKEQLAEMVQMEQQLVEEEGGEAGGEEEEQQQQQQQAASNDGPVSKKHNSWLIFFGMAIIAMLILVGSFMVANAYFTRMALKNRARAAEGRGGLPAGGGGGHREKSSAFQAPSSVTFSTD